MTAPKKPEAEKEEGQGTELVAPLPENWQDELALMAVETASNEQQQSSYISTKGGNLSFQKQAIPGNKISVVVLNAIAERSYYTAAYDSNSQEPPLCFALGDIAGQLVPHDNSQEKQHTDCKSCPLSQWKSDPKGSGGQACKERRRLVLLGADLLAGGEKSVMNATAIGIKIPPTSVSNWAGYAAQLANVIKRPPFGVVTCVSLRPHPKYLYEIVFEFERQLDEPELAAVMAKRKQVGDAFHTPWDKPGEGEAEAKSKETDVAKKRGRKY